MVYAHEIKFCTTVLSEEILSPNLLDIKQLSSAFQSLILNVLFCCLAAEIHQDSAKLNASLEQTDSTLLPPASLNSAQSHYSLFLWFRLMCVSLDGMCVTPDICVCIQICK